MTAPLLSEERIHRLMVGVLEREGWPTDEDMSIENYICDALREAVRETAEACAQICDDIANATEPEDFTLYSTRECAAEIRRRMGGC